MATFSFRHEKKHGLSNQMTVLLAVALVGVFVILAPLNASLYNSINSALSRLDRSNGVSVNTVSFTADQNYWEKNCNHGWDSDTTCDTIVARVQSCQLSLASAYCTSNENYMQAYFNK